VFPRVGLRAEKTETFRPCQKWSLDSSTAKNEVRREEAPDRSRLEHDQELDNLHSVADIVRVTIRGTWQTSR
jgi:hypothetical protein